MFTILTNKLGWKCHTRDLRLRIQDIPQTPSEKLQTEKINPNGWVGGAFLKEPPTHQSNHLDFSSQSGVSQRVSEGYLGSSILKLECGTSSPACLIRYLI